MCRVYDMCAVCMVYVYDVCTICMVYVWSMSMLCMWGGVYMCMVFEYVLCV